MKFPSSKSFHAVIKLLGSSGEANYLKEYNMNIPGSFTSCTFRTSESHKLMRLHACDFVAQQCPPALRHRARDPVSDIGAKFSISIIIYDIYYMLDEFIPNLIWSGNHVTI